MILMMMEYKKGPQAGNETILSENEAQAFIENRLTGLLSPKLSLLGPLRKRTPAAPFVSGTQTLALMFL